MVTHRSKSATSNASFNRFLKPGALARQVRDSRISTAVSRVYDKLEANAQISGGSDGDILRIDESFVLTMRAFGPRFLQRKKIGLRKSAINVAAASVEAADVAVN